MTSCGALIEKSLSKSTICCTFNSLEKNKILFAFEMIYENVYERKSLTRSLNKHKRSEHETKDKKKPSKCHHRQLFKRSVSRESLCHFMTFHSVLFSLVWSTKKSYKVDIFKIAHITCT